MLTCYAAKGEGGRLPDLKPGFFKDGAKLYAIAKEHGADLIKSGHNVEIQTAAAPNDRHATWYINFSKPDGKSGGLMIGERWCHFEQASFPAEGSYDLTSGQETFVGDLALPRTNESC